MKGVETIITDIEKLPIEDLKLILQKIVQRINNSKKINAILSDYQGIGAGIWENDAQDFINNLRASDL